MLANMTVKGLREIAKRMGIVGYSRLPKIDLVEDIEMNIQLAHTEALKEDAERFTYTCQLCGEKVQILDQPDHMIAQHTTLHTDSPIVIDTEEFPMDHEQFTVWYNRHGGIESFDVNKAMASDHSEAIEMNESLTTFTLPNTDTVLTGKSAMVTHHHIASVKRFNPTLKRDKEGVVILSAKQRRRVQKHTHKYAKGIGFYAVS